MAILLIENSNTYSCNNAIGVEPDWSKSQYEEGGATTPGYATYMIFKIRTETPKIGNLEAFISQVKEDGTYSEMGIIPISDIGETYSSIRIDLNGPLYLNDFDWIRCGLRRKTSDDSNVWWGDCIEGDFAWQAWSESPPSKPINPTPSNVATGVKLGLTKLTWESGS